MSYQRHTIEETELEGRKVLQGRQFEFEKLELELARVNRLQQDKDEEMHQLAERFEAKQLKNKKRADT